MIEQKTYDQSACHDGVAVGDRVIDLLAFDRTALGFVVDLTAPYKIADGAAPMALVQWATRATWENTKYLRRVG